MVQHPYYMSRLDYSKELPFYGLSDFQLTVENESCKQEILTKMTNNGFIDFIKNSQGYSSNEYDLALSRYYDMEEYSDIIKKFNLNIIHMNCRMLSHNKGKITSFLDSLDNDVDIIMLSEIGKEGYRYLESLFPNYDHEFDLPKNNNYGGVAIMAKKYLSMSIKSDMQLLKECTCTKCEFESVWVEINNQVTSVLIGCTYRHPNGNINHFLNQLSKLLENIPEDSNCIYGGDININLLNISHTDVLNYVTELSSHNFLPKIILPTRITDSTCTLIDHLFVKLAKKFSDISFKAGNIFADITDHLPIFVSLDFKTKSSTHRPLIRIISDRSLQTFSNKCSNIKWEQFRNMSNTDDKFDFLQSSLISAFNESFPFVQKSRKRNKDKKWMTRSLKISIRHKNRLYKKKTLTPTLNNINRYKEYNKILQESLKLAEEKYYQNLFNDTKNSSINMWKALGSIINPIKKRKQQQIPKLIIGDNVVENSKEISDKMNEYFCTIGKKLANVLPNGKSFNSYLKNKVPQTMFLSPIQESEIRLEILKLNNRKSPGPDNLSPKILKSCEPYLRKPLTEVFNHSFQTGTYPSKLKIAKVIALYKKSSYFLPENYRPISLLSCLDKIFEKLIHKRLMEFINKYKIIILEQYGFLKDHSTMCALIDVIDNVRNYIDKGEYALGIFLDLKKAFDTVNHTILLSKLEYYGFRGHVNKFLASYLTNRNQYTVINGSKSETMKIETGVPQGSVLGPLFFLLYINDITVDIKFSKTTLFADDTSLILHHKDIKTLKDQAEKDLKNVYEWLLANKLSLSWEKTNFIIFHTPRKPTDELHELKVYEFSIKRVKCVKYLGMYIDEFLKWDEHVDKLCNTLSKNFHIFYSLRNVLTHTLKMQLYFSMVYSRITYGIILYGACASTLLKKVQIIQNKLLKVLFKLPYRTESTVIHRNLEILKVRDIYKHQILKFVYQSINKISIVQFHDYYTMNNIVHHINTRQQYQLHRSNVKTKYGEHALKNYGVVLWNNLTTDIQRSQSLSTFEKAVRKSIITTYSI